MATPSPREIFQAADMLTAARPLVSNAYLAAIRCNGILARILRALASAALDAVEARLATAPAAARAFYSTDDVIVRQVAAARAELARIDALLARCPRTGLYPLLLGGTFAGSRDKIDGHVGAEGIELAFDIKAGIKCEKLCLVSAYYIIRDATGEVLKKPSEGYKDGFDSLYGGTLPDSDAADGVIVDAPRFKFANDEDGRLTQVDNTSPCMPTSKRDGDGVTAEDAPNFLKPGYTAIFETCLVCLDERPKFTIHGCVVWRHRPGLSEFIPDKDGNRDRKRASEGFEAALERYLANHPQ